MIKVNNLSVSFGNQKVINNLDLELPKNGLVSICGPSGCGKTTFLNCLAGLINFQGQIIVDGLNISQLSNNEKDTLRLYNYGFVFQDFKLFENETVKENILFPLKMVSNDKKELYERKINDLISAVSVCDKKNDYVSNLSGGHKQRVAIARALVNDPKIILADEPTGALDTQTGESIMFLLRQISRTVLVVLVTHDLELAQKYSDSIVYMNNGQVSKIEKYQREYAERSIPICRNGSLVRRPSIPLSFLTEHSFHSMKRKKGRSIICGLITSLGLIGFGGSIVLTDNISKSIKSSYGNLLEKDRITISVKNENQTSFGRKAVDINVVNEIAQSYKDLVDGVGVVYESNFEEFFVNANSFYIFDNNSNKKALASLSARSINEYRWLVDNKDLIYPSPKTDLKEDEVILAANYALIYDICWQLRIARTIESLSDYLKTTPLYIYLDVANYEWDYTDQQILRVVGFTLDTKIGFYHSNHLWNELMLEERMRFPSSYKITGKETYPWTLRKTYYLKTLDYNKTYSLLKNVRSNSMFKNIILEIPDSSIYPDLLRDVETSNVNRLCVYENYINNIPLSYPKFFELTSSHISCPIYGCNAGYSIYPSNLMSGFSSNTYFSFNEESLTKVIDANSTLSIEDNEFSTLPQDVLSGHFAKSLQNSVKFSVFNGNLLSGSEPKNIDEVAISSGMLSQLIDSTKLDTPLLISYTANETIIDENKMYREFITKQVKVTGIVDDSKYTIYQDSFWTIGYFQCFFGLSAFDLNVTTVSYKVDDSKNVDQSIKELASKFPQFEIVNPFSDINQSIDEICGWIEVAISIFSSIAVVTSILLLSICNYLHILENRKDISLARCIGASKKESKKFIYSHSMIMCLVSFILSSIELIIVSVFTSMALSKSLSTDFTFSFNPLAVLLMLGLSVAISIFSSFVMGIKISKIEPLEGLKY